MNKTFSISEAISFGWNTFKSNWKFWVLAWGLAFMSTMGGANLGNSFSNFDSVFEDEEPSSVTNTYQDMDFGDNIGTDGIPNGYEYTSPVDKVLGEYINAEDKSSPNIALMAIGLVLVLIAIPAV